MVPRNPMAPLRASQAVPAPASYTASGSSFRARRDSKMFNSSSLMNLCNWSLIPAPLGKCSPVGQASWWVIQFRRNIIWLLGALLFVFKKSQTRKHLEEIRNIETKYYNSEMFGGSWDCKYWSEYYISTVILIIMSILNMTIYFSPPVKSVTSYPQTLVYHIPFIRHTLDVHIKHTFLSNNKGGTDNFESIWRV